MLIIFRRHCSALRTLIVALLVFGLALQPLVISASEVHESQHMLTTGHSHEGGNHASGIPEDEAPSPDGETRLHSLLHQGHCCVHGAAIPLSTEALIVAIHSASPAISVHATLTSRYLVPVPHPPILG